MTPINASIPLVSIALCTYNGKGFLKEQLDSLLAQDYQNVEIIIIDDCSSDSTAEIIQAYQKEHPTIYFEINEQNLGFNNNFQKALSLCKGEYIAIADQDDIWMSNKISLLVEHIGDNLLLYHNSEYIDDSGKASGLSTRSHHRFVSGNCTINFLYYNCVSGHACLISKKLLPMTPSFPTDFYYDWWFAYTAACAEKIDFLETSLVQHRLHHTSSTSKDIRNPKDLRLDQFGLFLNHPATPEYLKQLLKTLIRYYEELRFKKFSLKLFLFLLKNSHQLFYIRKKSTYSTLKFLIKESTH